VTAPKSAAKPHKKLVPGNFVEVIDALLDVVMSYNGAPVREQQQQSAAEPLAMDLDQQSPRQLGQQPQPATGPPAAAAAAQPAAAGIGAGTDTAPLPVDLLLRKLNPAAREVGIQALVLRLLGDYCLLYNNTVGLLLKRDSDAGQAEQRHHLGHHSTPGPAQAPHSSAAAGDSRTPSRRLSSRHKEHSSSGGAGQHPAESHKAGVVLKHIMQVQLVDELPPWGGNTNTVRANASALLQAVCIRSAEGRRRILHELVATLNSSINSPKAVAEAQGSASAPIPAKVRGVLAAVNMQTWVCSLRMSVLRMSLCTHRIAFGM
jgi:hypothetical protein